MTNEEILAKALEKAEKNGFDIKTLYPRCVRKPFIKSTYIVTEGSSGNHRHSSYEKVIFSHDFAKAFWGEEEKGKDIKHSDLLGVAITSYAQWQYHLREMVLEEDPISYLAQFLDE